jgi:hypothetical protein
LIALAVLGGILVAAGLFGLGYCIRQGFVIRRAALPAEEVRRRLHGLIAVNLASVAGAALGLALLVVGLVL